ncbi:MAG TPA: MerR family transcriptional regulator [Chloroflexota bacterium]|jgi:DNA-binding transcriptional MerR regulator|nr:MerR family transcriptional regulator [Chloroflexota bacterium]
MTVDLLSIGEVAARTGMATSALRYYEQLGLVRPLRRDSGQRRYAPSVVQLVGVIALLQEVGFTLRDVRRFLESRSSAAVWRELANRKLEELDRQIARAQTARSAIEHSLSCPKERIVDCPSFQAVAGGVSKGLSLGEAQAELLAGRQTDAARPVIA